MGVLVFNPRVNSRNKDSIVDFSPTGVYFYIVTFLIGSVFSTFLSKDRFVHGRVLFILLIIFLFSIHTLIFKIIEYLQIGLNIKTGAVNLPFIELIIPTLTFLEGILFGAIISGRSKDISKSQIVSFIYLVPPITILLAVVPKSNKGFQRKLFVNKQNATSLMVTAIGVYLITQFMDQELTEKRAALKDHRLSIFGSKLEKGIYENWGIPAKINEYVDLSDAYWEDGQLNFIFNSDADYLESVGLSVFNKDLLVYLCEKEKIFNEGFKGSGYIYTSAEMQTKGGEKWTTVNTRVSSCRDN